MDCLSPYSRVQTVVWMKGAQIAGSEVGNNWFAHSIAENPGPLMLVMPTVDTAKRVSKQRIQPMIDSSPTVRRQVKPSRARDSGNTLLIKEFIGGLLIMTGANSAPGLRSMPIRDLFCDEVDAYPYSAGKEGDPIALAMKRQKNFPNKKRFFVSTPTIKDISRIERMYLETDQRKYFVPCPRCDYMQLLEWKDKDGNERIKWPEGKPRLAWLECANADCKFEIQDRHKTYMLARGEWRPTAEDKSDGLVRGYHLSSLYSPHGWQSWGEIAEEFLAAKDDPNELQVWVNTNLGETWDSGKGDLPDKTGLLRRREQWSKDGPACPAAVRVLTCGVDIQDDRCELEVVGWGPEYENWSIDYKVIFGDPTGPRLWRDLEYYLQSARFPVIGGGKEKRIAVTCIDTGDSTQHVYAFIRDKHKRHIFGIKGKEGPKPVWSNKPRKVAKGTCKIFIVGTDTAKRDIYKALKRSKPGPGYCHFPMERDGEFFKQLTSEKMIIAVDRRGHRQISFVKPPKARNEALDCRVYASAGVHAWQSMGGSLDSTNRGQQDGAPTGKVRKSDWSVRGDRETPWFGRG